MFKKFHPGQRSGEAASNAGRNPITHPAFGLFRRPANLLHDCSLYVRRVLHFCKTGVPDTFIYEYAESARSLSESALTTYLQNHYGYPGRVPILQSLQARAVNPSAEIDYLSALANDSAAREEWEKIISRLIELLHWMDESNEVYERWLDEVWEPVEWEVVNTRSETSSKMSHEINFPKFTPQNEAALREVYNKIDSAQANAKHEFFVIMEEIWENLWDWGGRRNDL